jgi:hypothetical protein
MKRRRDLAHPRAAFSNSACCPGALIIGRMRPVLEVCLVGHSALIESRSAAGVSGLSSRLPSAESKEQRKMTWLNKVQQLKRNLAYRLLSKEPDQRKELWIEELEERIVPNAIWSD